MLTNHITRFVTQFSFVKNITNCFKHGNISHRHFPLPIIEPSDEGLDLVHKINDKCILTLKTKIMSIELTENIYQVG